MKSTVCKPTLGGMYLGSCVVKVLPVATVFCMAWLGVFGFSLTVLSVSVSLSPSHSLTVSLCPSTTSQTVHTHTFKSLHTHSDRTNVKPARPVFSKLNWMPRRRFQCFLCTCELTLNQQWNVILSVISWSTISVWWFWELYCQSMKLKLTLMWTVLFWAIKQRVVVVIPYRRFGTTYRSQRQGSRIQY